MPVTTPSSTTTSSTVKASRTSAPAAEAASTSSASSTTRRGPYPYARPSAARGDPATPTGPKSRESLLIGGQPVASSCSRIPQRASAATAGGCNTCVEIVSLGNVALSTSSTRYPARASSIAVGDPPQRAPTTIAS